MSDIQDILAVIRKIRDDRDWAQFHDYKSLASSITIEAAELLEHFQWKAEQYVVNHKEDVSDEVADVIIYAFELADKMGIDIKTAVLNKLEKNVKKYPVEKAKGNAKKYTEL